jgi:hypothetical protein
MAEKKQYLDACADLRNKMLAEDPNSIENFVLIGMELTENGHPKGMLVQSKCNPFLALGILEHLTQQIANLKKEIMAKISDGVNDEASIHEGNIDSRVRTTKDLLNTLMELDTQSTAIEVTDEDLAYIKALRNQMAEAAEERDMEKAEDAKRKLIEFLQKRAAKAKKKDNPLTGSPEDVDINDLM